MSAGFTLIELVAVLLVVSLISAMATIRWSGILHPAAAKAALDRLQLADQHMRFARSRGRACRLEFDVQHGRYRKLYGGADDSGSSWESLGGGVQLGNIKLAGEKVREGTAVITFDVNGMSPTYGVHLQGPGNRFAWLVVAGVSGEATQLDSERNWHATLDMLVPPRL